MNQTIEAKIVKMLNSKFQPDPDPKAHKAQKLFSKFFSINPKNFLTKLKKSFILY